MTSRYVRGKAWCEVHRKVGYASPEYAAKAARNRNRNETKHDPVQEYRCQSGNGWHVGHR